VTADEAELEHDEDDPFPTPNPTNKLVFAVAIVASSLASWSSLFPAAMSCSCFCCDLLVFSSMRSRCLFRIAARTGTDARVDLMQTRAEIPLLAMRAFAAAVLPLAAIAEADDEPEGGSPAIDNDTDAAWLLLELERSWVEAILSICLCCCR
jgi:hypothetical protein